MKAGMKSKVIINGVDLQILNLGGLKIMEIRKKLNIRHNSLKLRMDKLFLRGFISFKKIKKSNGKQLIITQKGRRLRTLLK